VRNHSKRAIEKIKKILAHYGQVAPVLVDANNVIVDGDAVWQAMTELGSEDIAVVVVTGRSDPEIKALRLALNRLPSDARWDKGGLREELQELIELSFDLELTGFESVEINHLLEIDVPDLEVDEAGKPVPLLRGPAISVAGDIWTCGSHRIGCGDPRDQDFVQKVAAGPRPRMCFIDPRCGPAIGDLVLAQDPIQSTRRPAFLANCLSVLRRSSADGAIIYACIDWRRIYELLDAGRQCGLELLNLCVWAKTNAETGSLYRNQHELICVFTASGTDAATVRATDGAVHHTDNLQLGRQRRDRTNLWTYRDSNAVGGDPNGAVAPDSAVTGT
jgi:hypothetical protein